MRREEGSAAQVLWVVGSQGTRAAALGLGERPQRRAHAGWRARAPAHLPPALMRLRLLACGTKACSGCPVRYRRRFSASGGPCGADQPAI